MTNIIIWRISFFNVLRDIFVHFVETFVVIKHVEIYIHIYVIMLILVELYYRIKFQIIFDLFASPQKRENAASKNLICITKDLFIKQ